MYICKSALNFELRTSQMEYAATLLMVNRLTTNYRLNQLVWMTKQLVRGFNQLVPKSYLKGTFEPQDADLIPLLFNESSNFFNQSL